jgi:hypothetical protein
VASVLWKHLQATQPSAVSTSYGPGDLTLGLKRALPRVGGAVTSAQVSLAIPLGYDESDYPALGPSAMDLAASLQAGAARGSSWGNAEVEYAHRGGAYEDRWGGALTGGLSAGSGVALRAELRGFVAPGAGDPGGGDEMSSPSLSFDPATADPSHLDIAGALSLRVRSGVWVEAEVRHALAGENTVTGTRWGVGFAATPTWRRTR